MGINLGRDAGTPMFMVHHGRMHAQRDAGSVGSDSADTPAAQQFYPRVTSFRSRRSSLTEAQQEVWERLWPRLGTQARARSGDAGLTSTGLTSTGLTSTGLTSTGLTSTGSGNSAHDDSARLLDTREWFGRDAPIVVEIGSGTGTSTLAMAQAEPDVDVVAVEVYRRGLAQLLNAIDREEVSNIRMVRGDGVDVLERMFPPASLTGVRVFFPDPWPKSRHHKRRLLQQHMVALIADRLRPGGVLHAATDHGGYAVQIAETGDAEPKLRRVDADESLPISVQRPITKYETKARDVGSPVTELLWVRRP